LSTRPQLSQLAGGDTRAEQQDGRDDVLTVIDHQLEVGAR
jgi:hypothetical protein